VEQTHEMFRTMGGMITGGLSAGDVEGIPDFGSILKDLKPASELCPGDQAYTYLQGLGLAHMDAHLKALPSAAELLAGDLQALLAGRGVGVKQV
jgi:hypothetical protein